MRIQNLPCALRAALLALCAAAPVAAQDGRVIVLGFDGADGRTAAAMMQRGELPNLRRLADQGTFAPLGTTLQAESPVAWASLNTGQNPAKTGVPGFIKRTITPVGVAPGLGHQETVERTIHELAPGGLLGLLASFRAGPLAAFTFGSVFVLFAVVFGLLLRIKLFLSAVLAALLGAAGAFGAWVAHGYLPSSVPFVVANPLKVESFWDHVADAGVPVVVLGAAMSWDRPERDNLRLLSGLGVPDVRGANGDWFVYTSDEFELSRAPSGRDTGTAGSVFRVDERNGRIEAEIFGPKDFHALGRLRGELEGIERQLEDPTRGYQENVRLRDRKRDVVAAVEELESAGVAVPVSIVKGDGRAEVTVGGHAQTLAEGEWSDWYRLVFEINPLVKAHAVTRLKIVRLEDPFRMYVNTLDIDPENPPFWQPISQPTGFSGELARATGGPYETFGWACMTMPFKDAEIDVDTFLEDIEFTMAWRERLTYDRLARSDWKVLMSVFSTTDRVQHMMYQYADPGHPLHDAAEAAREVTFFGRRIKLSEAVDEIYRQMDRIVGRVMKDHVRPGDTLMLCADHGFQSFRRGVHVNNWLEQHGYLVMKEGPTWSQRRGLAYVDWSETRAYAIGLGMIYLNLEGREPDGIVKPEEARPLMEAIKRDLLAGTDPVDGARYVQSVTFFEDVHEGPYLSMEGDVMPGFAPGYRVSWSTTLGDISLEKNEDGEYEAGPILVDNDSNWSGDHVSVDPEAVRGIFFTNRPVVVPETGVDLLHVAPTVLSLAGVPVPPELDLAPLAFQD